MTRATFRSAKHFHSVVMQQGRVQVDADWNESVDILSGLDETTRIDTIGPHGVPKAGGGFEITVAPDGADLLIGAGRIYVDGLLCESGAERVEVTDLQPAQLSWRGWCWTTGRCNPPTGSSSRTPAGVVDARSRGSAVDGEARTVVVAPALTDTTMADATVRRAASYAAQPDLPAPIT